jgi:hypothetical protein
MSAFAFLSVSVTAVEGVLTILPCRSSMKNKEVILIGLNQIGY